MLHSAPQRHGQQKVQHHEQIHSRQQALISVIGQRINVTSAQLRMIDIEQSYHLIQQEEQPADSSGKHRPKTLANTIKLIQQSSITQSVTGIQSYDNTGKFGRNYPEKCKMPITDRSLLVGTVPDDVRKNMVEIILAKSS